MTQIGSKNHRAKLDEDKVAEIKRIYATGEYGFKFLADKYGVHPKEIYDIVKGFKWKHVQI